MGLKMSEKNNDKVYVTVDGQAFELPGHIKAVFQCKRGFWWCKARHPEITIHERVKDWTPEKQLIHVRESGMLKPMLTEQKSDDWRKSVRLSSKSKPSNLEIVPCVI